MSSLTLMPWNDWSVFVIVEGGRDQESWLALALLTKLACSLTLIRATPEQTERYGQSCAKRASSLAYTAVSDIPEGCVLAVLVGPRNSQFFTFSDRLLTISHAIYLISNKVTLNRTRIAVFLYISYIYLRTCNPSSPKFELLKIVSSGKWGKGVKDLANCS